MSGYLTNVDLSEKIRNKVNLAAEISKMKVEYREHPMPHNFFDDGFYKPENFIGIYGSIFTYEKYGVDHGPFWRAYEKL